MLYAAMAREFSLDTALRADSFGKFDRELRRLLDEVQDVW
jgi:hypothetical protein